MLSQVFSEADHERFDARGGKRQCGRRKQWTGESDVMQHPKPSSDRSLVAGTAKERIAPKPPKEPPSLKGRCGHLHVSPVKTYSGHLPGSPVVKTSPSSVGEVPVQSLVRELKSHLSQDQKTKSERPKNQKVKQKQYCNKFNKDFKWSTSKKIFKKKKKGLFWTSGLQNYKRINFSHLKPPSLW